MRHSIIKACLAAVCAVLGLQASVALAAGPDYQGLGLPGPLTPTQIQLDELRVTYRFDQMGLRGKAQDAVPVQTTYKFHNPGAAQTLDVAVPLSWANGKQAELTAAFVNGKEVRAAIKNDVAFSGSDRKSRAAVLNVTVFENADLILDLRLNQPVEKLMFPFDLRTGAGWNGTVQTGTLEAILPFDAANWNLTLRKRGDDVMLPLAYSGRAAAWSFNGLKPEPANDVYWTVADPSAMDYYARGNQRYQQTQGDAESYAMMRNALLDMVPCGETRLPLSTWWNNTYDTVTTGLLVAQFPEGMERLSRALEMWSDNWNVPHGDDAACQAMRQRPDRYRQALKSLLALPQDQRSAQANTALTNHYRFLRNLAAANVPGTKLATGDTDPFGDVNVSDADKQAMSQWDDRFAATGTPAVKGAVSQTATTLWNKVKAAFPKLSLRTQIVIFVLLALIVLIGIALIAFGWKEKDEPTWDAGRATRDGNSDSPSVFKPGPASKPLYDRPTSISGANFARPAEPKKLDESYEEPQSGLGSFKKSDLPAVVTPPPAATTAEVAKPTNSVPPPPTNKFPSPPKAPATTTVAPSSMPWEQPVKLDPVTPQKSAPPAPIKTAPSNPQLGKQQPSNTNADHSEHKNGPTVKI